MMWWRGASRLRHHFPEADGGAVRPACAISFPEADGGAVRPACAISLQETDLFYMKQPRPVSNSETGRGCFCLKH